MNGNAHKAIAEAAMKIVRPDLNSLLNEKISKKNWDIVRKKSQSTIEKEFKAIGKEVETYWDLFVLGAVVEDYTELESDLDEPNYGKSSLGKLLQDFDGGEYQHWLEHFWNTDMTDDHNEIDLDSNNKYGFVFTHEYVCSLLSELVGADYFLRSGSIVLSTKDKIRINIFALIAEGIIKNKYKADQLFDSYFSAPNRAQRYWDKLIQQYKRGEKERAIFNLGKVCHLLADVGTPAHMHGDGHCDKYGLGVASQIINVLQFHLISEESKQIGLDDDEYESYTSRIIEENGGNLPPDWDVNSDYGPIYKQDWDLFSFFKDLGDYSRRFDSDDCDGTGYGKPYHWEHFDYLTSIVNAMFLQETGLQRQTNDDLTEYACNAIAIQLIPLTIRYTAGILYLFAKTLGLKVQGLDNYSVTFDKIEVHDDTDPFGSGELYFTLEVGDQKPRHLRFDANSGDTIYLKKRKINPDDIRFNESISNNTSIHVHTEGEDNDDWWFIVKVKESESLGSTDKNHNISDIDHEHENNYEEKASNYTIHYCIQYEGREEYGEIQCENTGSEQLRQMKLSRYKEGENLRMQPLKVNFDTMHLHLSSLKHKPCQIGKKAKGRTVTFYQNDDELFKPKRINSKLYIDRFNKMLDLGEKWLDDPKFKNQLRDIPELEKVDKTEFRNQIKLIREEINNKSFQKKFKDFCQKSDTEYQIVTEQILKLNKGESLSNTETPKWACKNEKDFYRAFSTECQCCKDKKTKSALERKIRSIEKKYPDLKER